MKLKKSIKIATIITSLTLMLTGCSNSASDKDIKQDNKDTLVTLVLDKGGVNFLTFFSNVY